MKKLFENANEYVRQSDWKDLALLKICLAALGVMIGAAVPVSARKTVFLVALAVFFLTCVPQLVKFVRILCTHRDEAEG